MIAIALALAIVQQADAPLDVIERVDHAAKLVRPGCPERGWVKGHARVRVSVDARGNVTDTKIVVTTAEFDLDDAAKDAVLLAAPFKGTAGEFDVDVHFGDERLSKPVTKKEMDALVQRQAREVMALANEWTQMAER